MKITRIANTKLLKPFFEKLNYEGSLESNATFLDANSGQTSVYLLYLAYGHDMIMVNLVNSD